MRQRARRSRPTPQRARRSRTMRQRARRGCRVALRRVGRRNRPDCSGTQEVGWSTAACRSSRWAWLTRRGGAALRASFCLAWRPTHATWARPRVLWRCAPATRAPRRSTNRSVSPASARARAIIPTARTPSSWKVPCRWRPATWLAWPCRWMRRAPMRCWHGNGCSMAKKARFARFPAPARRLFRK